MTENDQLAVARVTEIVQDIGTLLEQAGWIRTDRSTPPGRVPRKYRTITVAGLRAKVEREKIEGLDELLDKLEAIERTYNALRDFADALEAAMAAGIAELEAPALAVYHEAKRLSREPGSGLEPHVRAMHNALRGAEKKGKSRRRR